ncbi:DUF1203 domain-containing protein [Aquimarina sp. M1]
MNNNLHNFQIKAINHVGIASLFELTDVELQKHNALRITVDKKPGFPCRISLEDAAIGEEVILVPYAHHNVTSPYKAYGPIFVRENVKTATPKMNEIPAMLTHRSLSVRGYNDKSSMISAETVHGEGLFDLIQVLFNTSEIVYLHIHNAGPGCFNCQIDRIF